MIQGLIILGICIALAIYVTYTDKRKTRPSQFTIEKKKYYEYMEWMGYDYRMINYFYGTIETFEDLVNVNKEMERVINKWNKEKNAA